MNYIEQIKGFWRSHDIETFSPNAIALYFYLLEINNKVSWMVSFKRNNSKICADLGISYPTLNISRNRLKQAGLIEFKTQNGNPNVTYSLKDFLKVTNEVSDEVTNEVSTEVSDTKDKLKHKTKTKIKSKSHSDGKPPVKVLKNDFWKAIVDLWFKFHEDKYQAKPTFPPAAANSLKSILKNIEKLSKEKNIEWSEETATKSFKKFLENAWTDKWLQENFLLPNLLSKFDSITHQRNATTGNQSGNGNGDAQGYKPARLDTEETVRRLEQNIKDRGIPGQY